jgi:ribosomal protein S18 acetylase RimI-like enzyme
VTAYRFCRTDDMGLLVAAYERCRGPEDAAAPALDRKGLKALVREQDLWCSSCMVALEGREPVGVLLGAKRAEATLVYGLRVHPGHRRRGHGRHLLTSLGQKLAILGPPRLVAEVPADRGAAQALFDACRWSREARLVDWRRLPAAGSASASPLPADAPLAPVTLAEAVASGLLRGGLRAWQRDLPSLGKRGERLIGIGFHSAERLEAVVFTAAAETGWEILAAGARDGEIGRSGLTVLLAELERRPGGSPLALSRVAPGEIDPVLLRELGFRPGAEHLLFASEAKAA